MKKLLSLLLSVLLFTGAALPAAAAEEADADAKLAEITQSVKDTLSLDTDGYSYFPAKRKEQEERNRDKHHDTRLVGLSACFAAACVIIGFLLGRFVG